MKKNSHSIELAVNNTVTVNRLQKPIFDLDKLESTSDRKLLIYVDSLQGYGADRVLVKLANGFADRGISIDLIVAKKTIGFNQKLSNGVNIVQLESSRFNPIKNIVCLWNYIQKNQPRCIITSIYFNNVVAACAAILSGGKTKLILRQANVLKEQFKGFPLPLSFLLYYAVKFAYKQADLLIAPCQAVALDMEKYLDVKQKKIEIVYNPTVTSDMFIKSRERIEHDWFRNNYHIVLSVGRLKPQKDFKTLLRAFAKVKQVFKPAKLIILGEGFLRKELEKLAIQLGIEQDVDLVGYKKNPYPYISKADVFVSSSVYEGSPNVIIEALAFDKKIVATDAIGGSAELLKEALNSELVPVGNTEIMAKAIVKALSNKSPILKQSKSKQNFNQSEQVSKYISLIQQVCESL